MAAPTLPGTPLRSRLSLTRGIPALRGRDRLLLVIGVGLLAAIALLAVLAPVVAPADPTRQDFTAVLQGPSLSHPFGTDQFGRDVLSRVLYAARIDLLIAFVLVGVALVVGTGLGILSGWFGGWFDAVLTRVVDVALAFPFLVLVICIVAVRGPGLSSLFVAVSLVAWVFYARLTRAEVVVARRLNYMRAAEASGFSRTRIFTRHLLPNVVVQPLLYASSDLVYALLLGASVSFLGLGVQPPTPEWGQMVFQGKTFVTSQWWLAFFPGLAIVVTGVAFSLIGDGLADRTRRGAP